MNTIPIGGGVTRSHWIRRGELGGRGRGTRAPYIRMRSATPAPPAGCAVSSVDRSTEMYWLLR